MFKLVQLCEQWHEAVLVSVMPAQIDRDSDEADSITRLVNLSLLALFVIICFIAEFIFFRVWELALSLGLTGLVMVGAPWIYKKTGSLAVARESFLISLFAFKVGESIFFASVISPATLWFVALPVGGLMLGSIVSCVCWLAASTGGILLLHNLFGSTVLFTNSPVSNPNILYTFSLVFLGLSLVAFILIIDTSRSKAVRRLQSANNVIRELANRDPLTGVFNRRYIWERLEGEERRAPLGTTSVYICLIDLDHFKLVNDHLGHAAGDAVLQAVARAIEQEIREEDCFGRYGGEEFLVILKSRNVLNPVAFAERIRQRVAGLRLDAVPSLEQVTISVGIARFHQGEPFDETINRADRALYAAKRQGRNCVVFDEGSRNPSLTLLSA